MTHALVVHLALPRLPRRTEAAKSSLASHDQEQLGRVERAVRVMAEQIDAERALVQVAGAEMVNREVDLGRIARELSGDMQPQLEGAGGEIQIGALPGVVGDPRALHQLLRNLIENAIKYRRREVPLRIEIRGERIPGEALARVCVADNGRGFQSSEAERIFDPFERVGDLDVPGTGIGLALCRKIAEKHGGSIRATGRPGEGALFEVFLPAGEAPNTDSRTHASRRDR